MSTRANLDWLINDPRRYPIVPAIAQRLECKMVFTGKQGANCRQFNVRCRCMAQCRSRERYYSYDVLGVVGNLAEARSLWAAHVLQRAIAAHYHA